MKLNKNEFNKLRNEWYEILRENGFNDIETINGDLRRSSSEIYRYVDEFSKVMKEDYFRMLSQAINDDATVFKSSIDKYIMRRHSEGAEIKTIMAELFNYGISRYKEAIRFTIRKYEMRWGIKYYTRTQRGLKKA